MTKQETILKKHGDFIKKMIEAGHNVKAIGRMIGESYHHTIKVFYLLFPSRSSLGIKDSIPNVHFTGQPATFEQVMKELPDDFRKEYLDRVRRGDDLSFRSLLKYEA